MSKLTEGKVDTKKEYFELTYGSVQVEKPLFTKIALLCKINDQEFVYQFVDGQIDEPVRKKILKNLEFILLKHGPESIMEDAWEYAKYHATTSSNIYSDVHWNFYPAKEKIRITSDNQMEKFWNDDEYALKEYVGGFPTDEMITSVQQELGYKLPASYVELMKKHNGGIPVNTCFPTKEPTSWAPNHIEISGIYGIGREKIYSLCGEIGSKFMMDEWGYPDIGVYFCNCPSAGHDMVALDYTVCGKDGEPQVVHVDQESGYKITFLAENFETFIKELVNEEKYNNEIG